MTVPTQIKKRLQAIIEYFDSTRGVGHTKTVIQGVEKNLGSAVIVSSEAIAREYEKQCVGISAVGLDSFDKLRGQKRPIVFDNHSLIVLFTGAYRAVSRLEDQAEGLERNAQSLKEENTALQKKLVEAGRKIVKLQDEIEVLTDEAHSAEVEATKKIVDKLSDSSAKEVGEAQATKISEDKK